MKSVRTIYTYTYAAINIEAWWFLKNFRNMYSFNYDPQYRWHNNK